MIASTNPLDVAHCHQIWCAWPGSVSRRSSSRREVRRDGEEPGRRQRLVNADARLPRPQCGSDARHRHSASGAAAKTRATGGLRSEETGLSVAPRWLKLPDDGPVTRSRAGMG